MTITVNGKPEQVPEGSSLLQLLRLRGAPLEHTVVERNARIVRKPDYALTVLAPGDTVEVLTFVGGG